MSGPERESGQYASTKFHKTKIIMIQCVCACIVCSASGITGCSKSENNGQQVETKTFQVPQGYRMSSSLAARINSIYIYDADEKQCALITEEIDEVHYSRDSYLKHLAKVRGQNDIDESTVIETDAMIACGERTQKKLVCYINSRLKCRDVSITFQNPSKNEDDVKDILHSYLNHIGEEDTDYIYSESLMKSESEDGDKTESSSGEEAGSETETKQDPTKTKSDGEATKKTNAGDDSAAEVQKNQQQNAATASEKDVKAKEKTANDFITVIDKTASHNDER